MVFTDAGSDNRLPLYVCIRLCVRVDKGLFILNSFLYAFAFKGFSSVLEILLWQTVNI